ncbi:unnamed protein product [Rotaria sordida]|uniref:EF-hand domain-containing protein n=1 Tax=Rotaria sordida TaxID=392033 RepID=A0A814UVQ6_9BILA|nr:unnamed protein product [Rotaria sordida]CAF1503576.1 unnamed protein product [Rotaria sordida]
MVDILYSLVDVTQRFDQLILDPFYIHNLDMTSMMMKSYYDRIYSIENKVLDRICKNILPRIHHQINELIVEQNSIERILHTINYPQLYSLSLIDFTEEVLLKYLTDNTTLRRLLSEQITCLKLDFKYDTTLSISETSSIIFTLILSLCKRSYRRIVCYDNLIIPLLQRMINLEELILFLSIIRTEKNYIDGIQLYDDILIYMPRLNKFIFNIDTNIVENNIEFALSSNEDIQRSFIRKEYGPVYSQVEIFSRKKKRAPAEQRCRYIFRFYNIKNNGNMSIEEFRELHTDIQNLKDGKANNDAPPYSEVVSAFNSFNLQVNNLLQLTDFFKFCCTIVQDLLRMCKRYKDVKTDNSNNQVVFIMDQRPIQESNTPSGDSINNRQQVTDHMRALIDENSALRQQNANLFQQLDRLRLEIVQQQTNHDQLLQKSLCNLTITIDELTNQLNDYRQELSRLQKENDHLKQALNDLQKKNDRDAEENKHCKNI